MSVYSREVADWQGSGYGALVATPSVSPFLCQPHAPVEHGCKPYNSPAGSTVGCRRCFVSDSACSTQVQALSWTTVQLLAGRKSDGGVRPN